MGPDGTMPQHVMVFDVESVGLHGDGFAVGFVVVDATTGAEVDAGCLSCDPAAVHGSESDRKWVAQHVTPTLPVPTHRNAPLLREAFWEVWQRWNAAGCWLAADVPWPVEARFLSACVDQHVTARAWGGPYPLVDVASVRLAVGLNPLATEERREGETPAHNPLADARQSARLLLEALAIVRDPERQCSPEPAGPNP